MPMDENKTTGPRFAAIDMDGREAWVNLGLIVAFGWEGDVQTGTGWMRLLGEPDIRRYISRDSYEALMENLIDENGGWV